MAQIKHLTRFIFSGAVLLAGGIAVPLPGHHANLHLLRLGDVGVLDVAILGESVLALFILQTFQMVRNIKCFLIKSKSAYLCCLVLCGHSLHAGLLREVAALELLIVGDLQ